MATTRGKGGLTDKEHSLLYEGANLSELSTLFKVDHRILKEKMFGLNPVGKRYNAEIYDVAEVAARMGKLTEEQVDKAMRRLNHADLPKALTKEYWAGKRSKQEYELRAGDLWPTGMVVQEIGEMVKSLKMELDLLTDAIERTTEMSDRQREIAKQLIDGAKSNMLKRLQEKFETKKIAVIEAPVAVIDDEWDDPDEL